MIKFLSLGCGLVYTVSCVIFYVNHFFDIGTPLTKEHMFITMTCLAGYLIYLIEGKVDK